MHVFTRAELVDQRQAHPAIMLQMFWLQANHSYGRRRSIPLAWTVYFGTSVPTLLLVLSGHRWRIEHSYDPIPRHRVVCIAAFAEPES